MAIVLFRFSFLFYYSILLQFIQKYLALANIFSANSSFSF